VRVLIADDDPISRRMLEAALRRMGHGVVVTSDGQQAWESLQNSAVRLVIADWMMPKLDGLELVRKIRLLEKHNYIYTVLLTSRSEKQDIIQGLAAGADDYVTKPFDLDELLVRVRAGERIVRLEEELAARNEQLRRLTLIDELTQIGNRRAFDGTLARMVEHCRRYDHCFGLLMIDIDHFKAYNDSFGHTSGDETLRSVAQLIVGNIRTADLAYRYGGEEFACILPETDEAGSIRVAERLRAGIEGTGIQHPGNPPSGVVTVSSGVACFSPESAGSANDIVRLADEALYRAKDAGRNRVVIYGREVSTAVQG